MDSHSPCLTNLARQRSMMIFALVVLLRLSSVLSDNNCSDWRIVRLSGGKNQYEGMVEVYLDDMWKAVCTDEWDKEDARVVCRQLGFYSENADVLAISQPKVRQHHVMVDMNCSGDEPSLSYCPHRRTFKCPPLQDYAGVVCRRIRLYGGDDKTRGMVQVYVNDRWGAVCADDWNHKSARVTCWQLGLISSAAQVELYDERAVGQHTIVMQPSCWGSESEVHACPRRGRRSCVDDTHYAGVFCAPIDLIFGRFVNEGMVNLIDNNWWLGACPDTWDTEDAHVACREMGFPSEDPTLLFFPINEHRFNYILMDMACTGNESSLQSCTRTLEHNCSADGYAGVFCKNLRLRGGPDQHEGILEVYYNGSWRAVCNDGWTNNATEICIQLGFRGERAEARTYQADKGDQQQIVNGLDCRRSSCKYSVQLQPRCSEYAGVHCKLPRLPQQFLMSTERPAEETGGI